MIYVETFSEHGSHGLYVYSFNCNGTRKEPFQTILSKRSPLFIVVSPNTNFLFFANSGGIEGKGKEVWGSIISHYIDQNFGRLRKMQYKFS